MSGRMVMQFNRFAELASKMPRAAGRICLRNANRMRAYVVQSMATPKHGRLYRKAPITRTRSRKGVKTKVVVGYKVHRASAPGESPAVDLGNLRAGIFADRLGSGPSAIVGVPAEYGVPLEFGTRDIRKRPFIRPALDAIQPAFEADMRNLEAELK